LHLVRSIAALAVLTLTVTATSIDARGHRTGQVPNGTILGCALCHNSPSGGDARNSFGLEIENGFLDGFDVVWGPELAALDSDGDGVTNGQELLDPEGVWNIGDANPGDPELITLPYDADSFSLPDMTAVVSSTWAQIKSKLR
jgi:hypothetical protein